MKIAYSFGIIDLLHIGHINVLYEAKRHSDLHVFGLVGDEAAKEWMGNVLSRYEERRRVLEQVACIDELVYQKTFDPTENLRQLHERYPEAEITLYHGNNWRMIPAEEYLHSIGGQVVLSKYYEDFSPENILRRLSGSLQTRGRRVSNLISTKADTLQALQPRLRASRIEPILIVTAGEFSRERERVLRKVRNKYAGQKIVVRSSASNEDSLQSSNAGHYDSDLDIDADDPVQVERAIGRVLDSYRADSLYEEQEQVLIQRQTVDVMVSGVVFTRDLQKNRPYYLVNYDDNGSTDSVTSGRGGKSLWIGRDLADGQLSMPWRALISAVREIEQVLDGMILDIEFAVTKDGGVVVFQVRPLAANYRFSKELDDELFFRHKRQVKEAVRRQKSGPDGQAMLFSDMAFWNPSEMIGTHPHELDYSLYREIITKRAWNEGLAPMGYRRVKEELMVRFSGKPYISIDYSFLSLIPAGISDGLCEKLVGYYKDKLRRDLTAHDKIEFEIVYSCFDFTVRDKLAGLTAEGFYIEECRELERALKSLTLSAIQDYFAVLKRDNEALERLEEGRRRTAERAGCQETNTPALVGYFTGLLKEIKEFGTPQFARQARYAFIARSLCNSLVEGGYVSGEEMDRFMQGINTVAAEFTRDMERYLNGEMAQSDFHERYGHLRSGTYDIRADRYDQISFQTRKGGGRRAGKAEPEACGLRREAVERALRDSGLEGIAPEQLTEFIRTAFEQRERFKFEFTKSLSLALEVLRMIGRNLGIPVQDLSYLQTADILAAEYYGTDEDLIAFWQALIQRRRELRGCEELLVMPDVLTGAEDIDVVCMQEARPNFITEKSVTGETAMPEGQDEGTVLSGRIVLLEKADPGFDWIFAQDIAGLITCYGGAASHMTIRCAEFGVPAAIGCGKKIYSYVSGLDKVCLDAKNGKITEAGR